MQDMDKILILKIILSFFIAGIWITSATLLAEKFGSKIGGLIANLPSNILISLLFVAMVNGSPYVIKAIPAIPIGMTINTFFLFIFAVTLQYGLTTATIISLSSWFVLALLSAFFSFNNLLINVLLYFLLTFIGFMVVEKIIKIPSIKKSPKKYSVKQIILRAVFAGSVVSSVVIISIFSNPFIAGLFSTFPAVLLTTMIILTMNQSSDFARATGKILMLSSTNIVIYGLAVFYTYPVFGIAWGTVFSFIIAFLWVGLFHPIVQKMD